MATARRLDDADVLAGFREHFFAPAGRIYFNANSLGLLSKQGEASLARIIDQWRTHAIDAWMLAKPPWFHTAERLGARIAPLVGAKPSEVVAAGTTTGNLHGLVATFYKPAGRRTRLLGDDLTFPSDLYALRSQVELAGLDPAQHIVLAPTTDGRFIDEAKTVELMSEDVSVAVLPSVLYRSGQLLDMESLTAAAHANGITIGFDCSHSVGAVPHYFDQWGVDFAFWCGYKYLNGGPGSPAFLYVNERHFDRTPGLAGWFGYAKDRQFELRTDFEHNRSAGGWQVSTPNILGGAALEGALEVIVDAGIEAIREKSLRMTAYLIYLIDEVLSPHGFAVGTPREPARRGGHVALEHDRAGAIFEQLKAHGVVGDLRPPNVIRLAPSPLYNTYEEIRGVVGILEDISKG